MKRIAIGLSDYAKKYLPADEELELLNMLPSEVSESDERNGMNEPLLKLENGETVHEIMLIFKTQ